MSKKVLIICTLGHHTGLGHFTRCKTLKNYINSGKFNCDLLKLDDAKKNMNEQLIKQKISRYKPNIIVFDIGKKFLNSKFLVLIKKLYKENFILIGIDNLRIYHRYLNLVWIPSFFLEKKFKKKNVVYGWDKFLLKKYKNNYRANNKIFILTGAASNNFLPKFMPKLLEKNIPKKFKLIWVQGRYSKKPNLNVKSKRWSILKKPNSYLSYLPKAGYIITIHGMSFYESLSLGIPTVCFPFGLNKKKDFKELQKIKKLDISIIESDYKSAIKKLKDLVQNKKKSNLLSKKCKSKFMGDGLKDFKKRLENYF